MEIETDSLWPGALWIASIFIKTNFKFTFKSMLDFEFKERR
jgi:hypothetical protein